MAGGTKVIQPLYDSYWLSKGKVQNTGEEPSPGEIPAGSPLWNAIMMDFKQFCYHHIIIDKNGHARRMVLNEAQEKVAEMIIGNIVAPMPEPTTMVILKSRQMGISTICILIEKYIASRKRNINLLHIFPTEKLAKDFYIEKVEPLWEASHPDLLPDVRTRTTPMPYMQVDKFAGRDMNVNLRFIGGNSTSVGRSGTNQVVIGDEYAYQENVRRLERGVLATVPKTGLALTVFLSTANGMNWFYDIWQASQKKGSPIKSLFLPWHMLKEYEKTPTKDSRFYDLNKWQPTASDLRLIDIFKEAGYPKETWVRKLAWYEHVLLQDAKGDEDYLLREFPSAPGDPFSATGRPVFPIKVINYWTKQDHPFTPVGMEQTEQQGRTQTQFVPVQYSGIRRYKEPEVGHRYSIGIDTATNMTGGDLSAGVVIDENNMEEVCSFVLAIDQSELAELVVNLAKYYNKARIIPERNMGDLFIDSVTTTMGYYNMYIDTKATTNSKIVYGIRTTQASKREAIRRFKFLMNNNIYKAHDKVFIDQLLHYSYKLLPSGDWKAEAIGYDEDGNPNHDDCHARNTMILTDKGEVPIQKIKPGDKVLTRDGYKKVVATSKRVKPCIEKFGRRWSPDHPIITPNGKKALCDIDIHDTIYTWKKCQKSNTQELSGKDTQIQNVELIESTFNTISTGKNPQCSYIDVFGKTIMGKFLRGILSTIKMATHRIMTSLTLNALHKSNIWQNIIEMLNGQKPLDKDYLRGLGIDDRMFIPVSIVKKNSSLRTRLSLGFVQGCVERGIIPRWARTYTTENVNVVIDLLKLLQETGHVATNASEKVLYAISIEDKHEYFADGVLVSNTIAARLTWSLSLDFKRWKNYINRDNKGGIKTYG